MMVTEAGFAGVAPFQDTQWPNGEVVVKVYFRHDNHGFVSCVPCKGYVVRAKLKPTAPKVMAEEFDDFDDGDIEATLD